MKNGWEAIVSQEGAMQDSALGRLVFLASKVGLADHRRLGGTGGLPSGEERRWEAMAWQRGKPKRCDRRTGTRMRIGEREISFPP
ncbi:MAG TPA: hypothetical protein VE965_02675, partial [Gammaproteobacteria bacterium]|nr:hypothetical protein [Gammaproteobacteria bacterium]